MNALAVLIDAWKNRDSLGDKQKSRELAAFLPAALEIQEAPPNPITQWLARALIVLVTLAIIWACVGKVNIVATAEGKIIPSSRVKVIQPLEKAQVKNILVKNGQYVSQGEPLIELDSTRSHADEQRIIGELQSMQLQLAVSQALLALLDQPIEQQQQIDLNSLSLNIKGTTNPTARQLHKQLLWQQWQQYWAQRQTLDNTQLKTIAERAVTQEVIYKLEQTLPIISQRTANIKALYSEGFVPETDYLQLEQERIGQIQDLAAEQHRYKQLQAAEAEVQQQRYSLTAQTKANKLTEMAESQRQIASLQEELTKATDINAKQILYAPVSGRVQELAINTIGGVVTEAQALMLIVPDQAQLEVEVVLENKDIGFVHEGMAAEIKIHTFPFTKYGLINGQITIIANDATVDEQRGLIYSMRLVMEKDTLIVNGKLVKLMPGMAVTAEIQTGKRRIIEFFLAPLMQHGKESIRER